MAGVRGEVFFEATEARRRGWTELACGFRSIEQGRPEFRNHCSDILIGIVLPLGDVLVFRFVPHDLLESLNHSPRWVSYHLSSPPAFITPGFPDGSHART
jgi:hypothetical protein